ncbi:MAG: amino acid ABC transporter substrate-binding protein [Methanobacteriota archaeon]|nr:MAG: amino acid ABC transporter substrate-binding protein [Euryarchaeota archaeon]
METSGAPPPEAVRGGVSKVLFAVVVVIVAIIAFVGGIAASSLIQPARPKLVVGTNAPFPPFESYDDATGQFVGFDIDIAQLVANRLGKDLVVRNFNSFDLLLATVGQGGVDMAVSAITMSGSKGMERNATMDFSNWYYSANQAVVTRSGYTFSCPNNTCGQAEVLRHTIGVQSGTTSEGWVDTYITGNQTQQIFRYQDVVDEISALRNSIYDLMIIDEGPAKAIATGSAGALVVSGKILTGELYGIAVPNNDPKALVPVINSVLADIRASGAYDQLITKWFT